MAGKVRSPAGGILDLLDLFDEGHKPALEADLIEHGFLPHQIGSDALPWHAVVILAKRLLETPNSALAVSVHGVKARWTAQDQLMMRIFNVLRWVAWSKTEDAANRGRPPEIEYLPGLEPEDEETKHYGKAAPIADVLALLGEDALEKYGDLLEL